MASIFGWIFATQALRSAAVAVRESAAKGVSAASDARSIGRRVRDVMRQILPQISSVAEWALLAHERRFSPPPPPIGVHFFIRPVLGPLWYLQNGWRYRPNDGTQMSEICGRVKP
jgi:hypothetical protein